MCKMLGLIKISISDTLLGVEEFAGRKGKKSSTSSRYVLGGKCTLAK